MLKGLINMETDTLWAWGLTLLLLLLLLYELLQGGQVLMSGDGAEAVGDPLPLIQPLSEIHQSQQPDYEVLGEWMLFGSVQEVGNPAAQQVLKTSTLNLTVSGVVAPTGDNPGVALFRLPNGKERAVSRGGHLDGGAKVVEIYADKVILERSGQLEELPLKQSAGRLELRAP
jgi:type II secretory pathway component PulC